MMNVLFTHKYFDEVIYNPDFEFDWGYEPDWIISDYGRSLIKEIDKSEVLDSNLIKSPILGLIPPQWLSGGTKALLMIKFSNLIFDLTIFGSNCEKHLSELAKEKDFTCTNAGVHLDFFESGINGLCLNNGKVFKSGKEYLRLNLDFLRRSKEEQLLDEIPSWALCKEQDKI